MCRCLCGCLKQFSIRIIYTIIIVGIIIVPLFITFSVAYYTVPISYNHVQNAQEINIYLFTPQEAKLRTDLIPITIMNGYYSVFTSGSCTGVFTSTSSGAVKVYRLQSPKDVVKIQTVNDNNQNVWTNVEIDCIESSLAASGGLITNLYYACMSLSWIMLIGTGIGLLMLWLCCASWSTCVCCVKNKYHKANAVMTFT